MGVASSTTYWMNCDAEGCSNESEEQFNSNFDAWTAMRTLGWKQHPERRHDWYCPKHAYLADVPCCPGSECPMCTGEACLKCGGGTGAFKRIAGPDAGGIGTPGTRDVCEHDVVERHETTLSPTKTARRIAKVVNAINAAKLNARHQALPLTTPHKSATVPARTGND